MFENLAAEAAESLRLQAERLSSCAAPSEHVTTIGVRHGSGQGLVEVREKLGHTRNRLVVYVIQIAHGVSPADARAAFVECRGTPYKFSRHNRHAADSDCLYVGSSAKFVQRVAEHLGAGHPATYALHLCRWFPPNAELRVTYGVMPETADAVLTAALEDRLWDQLGPMFGRRGAL